MTAPAHGIPEAAASADTLSERAAVLVEHDILTGQLEPGARLGIVDLARRYEIGATPLREGLSRLVSRGLIVPQPGYKNCWVNGLGCWRA